MVDEQKVKETADYIIECGEDISLEFDYDHDENGHPVIESWVIKFTFTFCEDIKSRIWCNGLIVDMTPIAPCSSVMLNDEQLYNISSLFEYGVFNKIAEALEERGVEIECEEGVER